MGKFPKYLLFIFCCPYSILADINDDFRKAIARGNLRQMKYLHQNGASINAKEKKTGVAPIHLAVRSGNILITEYLLEHGADPNLKDDQYGLTPLLLAAYGGNLYLLKLLISRGGDITLPEKKTGYTSLHITAEKGHYDCLEFLIAQASKLDIQDKKGMGFLNKVSESQKDYFEILVIEKNSGTNRPCAKIEKELSFIGIGNFDLSYKTQGMLFEKIYNQNKELSEFKDCLYIYLNRYPDKFYWTSIFLFDEEYTKINNFDLAKETLDKGIETQKKTSLAPSLYFLKGILYWREDDKIQAKTHFQKAYELSKKYPGSIPALRIQEKAEIDKFMGNKME